MAPEVEIRGLGVRFGEQVALADLDLDVEAGTSLAVIGPNGSGKSTLLGALAGTIQPTSGSISFGGSRPALVQQTTEVDRSLPITVKDVVSLARYPTVGLLGRFGADDKRAVDAALGRLQVDDLVGRQFHDLSGGQQQRVLVAQGLAQDAEILLLDEPVTGLDIVSHTVINDVIGEEVAAGRTVVVTTHSFEDARRHDQVLLLKTHPVAVGTPENVLTEEHLRVAFGGSFIRLGDDLILDDPHHHH